VFKRGRFEQKERKKREFKVKETADDANFADFLKNKSDYCHLARALVR
jgi:hypothetical protein